ncbi:hypothetical protein B0H19DRAFT_1076603 [Mycena capillaripes]|nr:hypothetical protein B0H19DRAFT_1076603 [Mycena capillaripes]
MSIHPALLLAAATCLSLVVCFTWQKFCRSPALWLQQLHSLGQPRSHMLPGTAVVCGGSIAGIVAARICADHFERVIIIDPETQDSEKPKTRIMQFNALHAYLALFLDGARRLWPHFDAEMKAVGGWFPIVDTQVHYSGVQLLTPYKDYPEGQFPETLMIRRSVLQKGLHRLLMQHATSLRMSVLPGVVTGVLASDSAASIDTVTVRQLDGTNMSLHEVALVVDCTGTTQAGLKWLNAAGFKVPDNIRSRYRGNLRYVTISFIVPPELASKLPIPALQMKTMLVYALLPHDDAQSSTLMLAITDNNTSMDYFTVLSLNVELQFCTVQLVFGDTSHRSLPRTAGEVVPFIAEFRGLNIPIPSWVIEVIETLCEHGEPTFDFVKIPVQSFVRYHSLRKGDLPLNFIALGDASLQLNPVHGQARMCEDHNEWHSVEFPSPYRGTIRFYRRLFGALLRAFCLVYGSFMTTDRRFVSLWMEKQETLAASCAGLNDEEVASALWHVRHMLAADKVLFAPTVLWKVLWTRSLF